jgi:hypothetical protein
LRLEKEEVRTRKAGIKREREREQKKNERYRVDERWAHRYFWGVRAEGK